MIISYHGKQFLKLVHGDTILAINPIGKNSKLGIKVPKSGANIAISTTNHPDYNGFETVTYKEEPFKIYGPGEYEVKDLYIEGFSSKARIDNKEIINTIYNIKFEGMNFWFLGPISTSEIDRAILESVEDVDVLFIPIGGEHTLSPIEAAKVVKIFSPKIVIPMDYGKEMEKNSLETFLKEMGDEKVEPESKLTLRRKDLDEKSGKTVVLSPS